MNCMFQECVFPKDFTLGDKFDTSQVISMFYMFYQSDMSKGFSLGVNLVLKKLKIGVTCLQSVSYRGFLGCLQISFLRKIH